MSKPQLPIEDVLAIIEENKIPRNRYPVAVVAVRGYWLDSAGDRGKNDRGTYDDACFIVYPGSDGSDRVERFRHNTDPTAKWRKNVATLQPGIHIYGPGPHNVSKGRSRMYPAFRQAEVVTVKRDGRGDRLFRGFFGINIHRGGGWWSSWGRTSSLGCQTFPSDTWKDFHDTLVALLRQHGNEEGFTDLGLWNPGKGAWGKLPLFPYILLDETDRRAGKIKVSNRYG